MARGEVAEDQRGAKRDARAGIGSAHEARGVVPDHVKALDHPPVAIERAGVRVGLEADKGADAARDELDRIEGRLVEWRDARVGRVAGRAV